MSENIIKQVKNLKNTQKMKNTELLNTQSNAEENNSLESGNKNTELIKQFRVNNSPIRVIHEQDKGWYAVMSKYRLTEKFKTLDEFEEYTALKCDLESIDMDFNATLPWAFMTSIISAIVDETLTIKEQSNNK